MELLARVASVRRGNGTRRTDLFEDTAPDPVTKLGGREPDLACLRTR